MPAENGTFDFTQDEPTIKKKKKRKQVDPVVGAVISSTPPEIDSPKDIAVVHRTEVLSEDSDIDFEAIYNHAVQVFTAQCSIGENDGEITAHQLKLSKARSENFLASVAGMLEISSKIEILKAEKNKFKRSDELTVLNSLRRQYEDISKYSEGTIKMISQQLLSLQKKLESGEFSPEDLETLAMSQRLMDNSIKTITSLNKGFSSLMETERKTGGREITVPKVGNTTNVAAFLETLPSGGTEIPKGQHKGDKGQPRELTEEEVSELMDNE